MPTFPDFNIAIDEETLDGLYRSFEDEEKILLPRFVKDTGLTRRMRFMQRSRALDRIWDDLSVAGATVEWAIGEPDAEPTDGTMDGEYAGGNSGLIGLAAGISAAAMQTALNANPGITSDGGVTVTKSGTEYTITWNNNGTRSDDLIFDAQSLQPASTAEVIVVVTGDASTREVRVLRIAQQPWAYTNSFTAISAGTVTQSVIRAGTDSLQEIQRIAISDGVYGGAFPLTLKVQEKTLIGTVASGGNAAIYDVLCVADVGGSLGGKFFDLYDDAGIVRVWIDVANGSTAPPTPTGGRLLEVDISSGDSAATVTTAVKTKIDADAKFVAYVYDTAKVRVLDVSAGARGTADAQNSGFTVTTVVAGNAGPLGGKYFLLQDKDGPVAVWFSMSGDTAPQTGDYNRAISVTITGTSTAAQVATAIQTAVDADAQFTATASGNTVTITDVEGGERAAATEGNATVLSIHRRVAGVSVSAQIPWNADATTFATLLGNNGTVTKTGVNQWDFTFNEVGDQPDITIPTSAHTLLFPQSVTMTLLLNKLALHQAFAETDADELTTTMEIRITFPAEQPLVVFHAPVTVLRNLIDLGTIGTLVLGTSPRILTGTKTYNPGSIADGDGLQTTVTVTGAALGDSAIAGFTSITAVNALRITSSDVTAADTVTVTFTNDTAGAPLDLPSGTLRAIVFKY